MKPASQTTSFRPVSILVLLSLALALTGCSTLASLGIPVGGTSNKLLRSAKKISEAPGQGILTAKELKKTPLASLNVEIGDTISVEPVSFDATIRLPGDQTVKPDGNISLGEFGPYPVSGKSVQQLQSEIQLVIDSAISSRLRREFAVEQQRIKEEELGPAKLSFEQEFDPIDADDFDKEDDLDQEDDADPDEDDESAELLEARRREANRKKAQREFDRELEKQLRQNRISVRLANWDSQRIYVLGEVNSPGSFAYIGNETVLDAIIEAGGISSSANHHSIIVSRPSKCGDCKTVMKVCYDHIVQLGDATTNYQLLPGDRVFVPSVSFMDDLKNTFLPMRNETCPHCACDPNGCNLPQGCE